MKKFIAFAIIINVFLSSIYLLVEKKNGVFCSIITAERQSDTEDSGDNKNPLYTELKSEKEDSKSNADINFDQLSFNPILINYNISHGRNFIINHSAQIKNNVGKNIPVHLINRSILI